MSSMWKKWLTTHIEREHTGFTNSIHSEHPQNESNSNVLEKPNINNRRLLVGPSFLEKFYLLLKVLPQRPNRDIYVTTKSPPEQYSKSIIKIKEIGGEIKPLNEYENAIMVFDDILGSSTS